MLLKTDGNCAVRHEFLEYLGLDADDVARKGNALALSQLDMKFRAPLRSKDIVRGTVMTSKVTGARIIMDQELYRLPREGETNQQVTDMVSTLIMCHSDVTRVRCFRDGLSQLWLSLPMTTATDKSCKGLGGKYIKHAILFEGDRVHLTCV